MGPWVAELDRLWRLLESTLQSRKLVIDLCGVLHLNSAARRLLGEIHEKTGADFLADSPMTRCFADEARLPSKQVLKEE
jgi:hypothetical protein